MPWRVVKRYQSAAALARGGLAGALGCLACPASTGVGKTKMGLWRFIGQMSLAVAERT